MVRTQNLISQFANDLRTHVRPFQDVLKLLSLEKQTEVQEQRRKQNQKPELDVISAYECTYKFQLSDAMHLFWDDSVELVCRVEEDDISGSVWCVFKYAGRFFIMSMLFGSSAESLEWTFINKDNYDMQTLIVGLVGLITYPNLAALVTCNPFMHPKLKMILSLIIENPSTSDIVTYN